MGLDYKTIAEGARSFYDIGCSYIERPNRSLGVEGIPFYVNTALACELFMKAIIVYKDPNTTKHFFKKLQHRLDLLFFELPPAVQNIVRAAIPDEKVLSEEGKVCRRYSELLNSSAPEAAKVIAKHQINNSSSSFEEMLIRHANIFLEWRYYYEAESTPIGVSEWFLYQFCNELHNVMVEIMNSK